MMGCSSPDKISFNSDPFVFDTYYNDNYFLLDNREVHEEIALASHAMALATFNKNSDYYKRSEYLVDLWNKEGFSNIYISESYYIKPQTDSIAFGISSKSIGDFTLIAIAVRGGFYAAEWTSNFTVGRTGNSQGFDEASDQVVKHFDEYVNKYNVQGHVKIWISGYSRAAITSNMTAGKILNRTTDGKYTGNYQYTSDDVYAYCFEPPLGVEATLEEARSDLYHGIHNFLNYNDFVPLVAPYEWGFVRYGTDHYYPDRVNDIYFDATEREKIISLYHFTSGAEKFKDYSVDKWKFFDVGETKAATNNLPRQAINPSQGRFSHALIHEVATTGFQDRDTYADYLQDGMRELLATAFGANPVIKEINSSALIDMIFEYSFIRNLFLELENGDADQFVIDVQMLFLQIFGADKDSFDEVLHLYVKNYNFFYMFANSFLIRKDILAQLLYRDNAMGLTIGHMPELSYSFLSACDSRFLGSRKCKFNDGTYYTLHIANPTSFSLMEKNLKKEVFSYKDGIMSSDCLSAEQLADGSINVYLPKNGEYEYICNCDKVTLSEVDPLKGETPLDIALSSVSGTI